MLVAEQIADSHAGLGLIGSFRVYYEAVHSPGYFLSSSAPYDTYAEAVAAYDAALLKASRLRPGPAGEGPNSIYSTLTYYEAGQTDFIAASGVTSTSTPSDERPTSKTPEMAPTTYQAPRDRSGPMFPTDVQLPWYSNWKVWAVVGGVLGVGGLTTYLVVRR